MNKVLVELLVPAAGMTFDLYVTPHARLYEVLQLTKTAVADLTQSLYVPGPDAALCDYESGQVLDLSVPLWQSGLVNGSRLMLI